VDTCTLTERRRAGETEFAARGGGDDLEDRLRVVCGHLNVLHAELVELMAEALEAGVWDVHGVRSPAHWLSWQAGLSPAHAAEVVRLAQARVTHPAVMSTLAAGAISLDQAAVATTVPDYLDEQFAELATVSTVAQLQTMARAARPAPPLSPSPSLGEPEPRPESVAAWFDDDGRYHLRGELDADHGRILDAALHEARDALFHAGQPDVGWVEALVEIANRSLDGEPAQRRERFRANWFIDPTDPVPARWSDGLAVPTWLVDMLSCDATVAPVFTDGAHPLSVGHPQATIPDRTRRLVLFRDRKCRVPWCPQRRWLQVHHIVHRHHGGGHDTANLAALCPSCHRAHHRGQLGITGNADLPDGLTFTDPHGRILDPAAHPTKPTGPPPPPTRPYDHPLGEPLQRWAIMFPDPPPTTPPAA
jgi:hypothetical protein